MTENARDLEQNAPAAGGDELVKFLAENTDLSPNQARDLVRRYGTDRKKLLEAAHNYKAEG